MAFSTGIPNAADSPADFPAEAQANWTRLKAIVNTDHQWIDAGGVTADGYHQILNMPPQAAPGAVAGRGRFYTNTHGNIVPSYQYPNNADGAIPECIYPPVLAYGHWDNTGNPIGQLFNCAAAYAGSTFTITLTSAPLTNPGQYVPLVTPIKYGGGPANSSSYGVVITSDKTLEVRSVNSNFGIGLVIFYLSIA